ncbi:MAG: hypothetical protein WAZ27_00605 [Minisyncoccia bacterium]
MKNNKKVAGILGATMAAAAGAYYLYGSEKASQHRRKASVWMRRAEREIVHEAKRLKDKAYTDENVKRVIKEVAKRYEIAKDIDPKDVQQFVAAVQKSWQDAGKVVKSRITKIVPKQAVKKVVKKVRATAKKISRKAK